MQTCKYVFGLVAIVAHSALIIGLVWGGDDRSGERTEKGLPQPHIKDVVAQIRFYAERLDESLAKADAYDESKQTRVEKDAATVAALANTLARHHDENDIKSQANELHAAAAELSANLRDHARAAPANERIRLALAAKSAPDDKTPETGADSSTKPTANPVDTNPMLMKQIRFIDNRLKRAARGRDGSEKQRAEVAGHAATLAALADAMRANVKHYGKDAARERLWNDQCNDMAAAAAKLNDAARVPGENLSQFVRTLDATCARCHADFR
jgi:cytochrome c556